MKNVYEEKQFRAHSLSILIAFFSLILTVSVIPMLLALILKAIALILFILSAAVISNPSEQSFTKWLSKQKSDPSESWLTSIIKSAVSHAVSKTRSWVAYNFVFFTIMDVHSMKRQAFGAFGKWIWTDSCPVIAQFSDWILETSTEGSPYTYFIDLWQRIQNSYCSSSFTKENLVKEAISKENRYGRKIE
ncbi:hypothetical protein ABG067_007092 [Albugo candida]